LVSALLGTGRSCLLISVGAKQLLMAWRLRWRGTGCAGAAAGGGGGPWLDPMWLATRAPPRRGLRPHALAAGANSSRSDQRFLAVSAFGGCAGGACGPAGHVLLLAASSDASLTLLVLQVWTDGQTDGRTDRQTDRQTDKWM
jgi:hypothetical protein